MTKRCAPGIICIENATMYILLLVILGGALSLYYKTTTPNNSGRETIVNNTTNMRYTASESPHYRHSDDVLLNPYDPPMRDNSYSAMKFMPINIQTHGVDTNYKQIGILTRLNGSDTILPLMGRPLFVNRDKWNFYTMNDKNNMIKLPITFKSKSCTSEYGCDNIYNGDTVYVEGYNDAFKATVYDNQILRYIPYL
uniref:Uncharacterized protein n=1 Tax=viral metagenome TaxID=1070528 RepID=A0A6C0HNA9_9ZZZZ